MAATYEPIATTTLLSTALGYTFSSIPNTYTDLVLIVQGSTVVSAGDSITLQFNDDTTSNYSTTGLYGTGSSAASYRESNTFTQTGRISTTQSTSIINIMNYTNGSTYKTVLARGNAPDSLVITQVSLWRKTEAITKIKIANQNNVVFSIGTTFTLYGIKAA